MAEQLPARADGAMTEALPSGVRRAAWSVLLLLTAIPVDLFLVGRASITAAWVVPLVLFASVPFWGALAYAVRPEARRPLLVAAGVGVLTRAAFMAVVLWALSRMT